MSGIVGVVHRDGRPVDQGLLGRMTRFLEYRGPDGCQVWATASVGFGHAMLRTSTQQVCAVQPAQSDHFWITSDARLDAPMDLTRRLQWAGRRIAGLVPDWLLILHAYAVWGTECVDHLLGDFAFGIWDSQAETLFCARDHLGIKPFYYTLLSETFAFSNTLNCLRQLPFVSNRLNESAIGDFLLFGLNYEKATTCYRDIQRLPPAHSLLVSRDSLHLRCYWRPPTEGRIRYEKDADYLEHFNQLLKSAVADRVGAEHVGIFLSGGLDSGAVAVVAKEISIAGGGSPQIETYTVGYDSLITDDEHVHARALAGYLNVPNKYLALDHIEPFEKQHTPARNFPEPVDNPLATALFEQFDMITPNCRVVLSGEGADNLMYFQMWPYVKDLWRTRQWSRTVKETAWFLWVRPLPWLGIARRIRSLFANGGVPGEFPSWVDQAFAKRANLFERWEEYSRLFIPPQSHLTRPKAHASMLIPEWADMFELSDPGVTHRALEVRYPFLDLRIVDYLLAIPAFPWTYNKLILRKGMRGRLPEKLRSRRKTPLSREPYTAKFRQDRNEFPAQWHLEGQICEFVRPAMIRPFRATIGPEELRPYCLDLWLRGVV